MELSHHDTSCTESYGILLYATDATCKLEILGSGFLGLLTGPDFKALTAHHPGAGQRMRMAPQDACRSSRAPG